MIKRNLQKNVEQALSWQAAVALIGPRQVGKTTLALEIADSRPSLYLDLESATDRNKLASPEAFLANYEDHLVIFDEIHQTPELFGALRGIIDKGRRKGKGKGRFLLLGSASLDLLHQSGESLAGRITYLDMPPLMAYEIADDLIETLWLRGGFPESFVAHGDAQSQQWREDMIRTYLERDIPMFGPRVPAETLRRFWTMLAHNQGSLLNSSGLAKNLEVSSTTVSRYTDLLVDLLLVRRLRPYHVNVGKRLVKSPKVYIRDSGLAHSLLNITDYNSLAGHPVVGNSWEGFVIENLIQAAPARTVPGFYRTQAGAEIDLLLELPGGELWAIEIKRSSVGKPAKGFYEACKDLKPAKQFVVYGGNDRYPLNDQVEVIGLSQLIALL
uniref:Mlr9349 protein n=1 Tax=uncultured Thiotrichaceae bacterium TaxID=298394 RepID=A0A6S6UI34_9GAMM|nr:MAG: Mlr9349 protein [uncultured Thiotrichaceae bacterium]